MTDNINNGLEKLKGTLQSDQFKKILPYLLIGGAGAAGGAALTGGRRTRKGESRMGYMGRVLRNALATGGLAAGAAGMARYGADKLSGPAASADGKQAPGMDNPTDQALRSSLFNPGTAVAAGGLGLGLTHKLPWIGANTGDRDTMRANIAKAIGGADIPELMKLKPNELKGEMNDAATRYTTDLAKYNSAVATGAKKIPNRPNKPFRNGLEEAARMAGLTIGDKPTGAPFANMQLGKTLANVVKSPKGAKGELIQMLDRLKNSPLGDAAVNTYKHPSNILQELKTLKSDPSLEGARQAGSRFTRRGMATFGQSGGSRALRTGVGLTAAALPALIGAFATKEKKDY